MNTPPPVAPPLPPSLEAATRRLSALVPRKRAASEQVMAPAFLSKDVMQRFAAHLAEVSLLKFGKKDITVKADRSSNGEIEFAYFSYPSQNGMDYSSPDGMDYYVLRLLKQKGKIVAYVDEITNKNMLLKQPRGGKRVAEFSITPSNDDYRVGSYVSEVEIDLEAGLHVAILSLFLLYADLDSLHVDVDPDLDEERLYEEAGEYTGVQITFK